MNLFRLSTVLLLAALATACASAPTPSANAPAESVVIDSTAAAAPLPPEPRSTRRALMPPLRPRTSQRHRKARTTSPRSMARALTTRSPIRPSPHRRSRPSPTTPEKFNRKVHAFNNAVDRAVARPLARAYVAVVPRPVRLGVGNFFDNLRQPLTMVNQLLQGRPRDATQTFGRFLLNSTVGIGGIFDPASDLKMKRRSEDFGQTLGTWGWKRSRYVELPFFGPRTVRDVLGLAGDMPLSPTRYVEDDKARIFLQGLNLVDTRAQLLSLDSLREGAVDDYALVRDSWLQRRNYQIESHRTQKQTEAELPEYLQDENNPTVPADAMPMPEISGGG